MPEWPMRYYRTRYLGNINPKGKYEFHDLKYEEGSFNVSIIIQNGHDKAYERKKDATDAGHDPCGHCMGNH